MKIVNPVVPLSLVLARDIFFHSLERSFFGGLPTILCSSRNFSRRNMHTRRRLITASPIFARSSLANASFKGLCRWRNVISRRENKESNQWRTREWKLRNTFERSLVVQFLARRKNIFFDSCYTDYCRDHMSEAFVTPLTQHVSSKKKLDTMNMRT